MKKVYLQSIFNLFGAINVGNGLWMLFFAQNWFNTLPAGLHDTGPLNKHFVHDVGLVYLLCGIALLYCAKNVSRSFHVYLTVVLFFVGHAMIHIVEILVGLLPPSHWLIDLPLIFVPALILIVLTPRMKKLQIVSE